MSGVSFVTGAGILLFATAPRPPMGPTQPPTRWVPGTISLGIKRSGHETDHSPTFSAEVKNVWDYTSILPCLYGMVLSSA